MGLSTAYGIGSLKPGVCTSTSRPASPFVGQLIFETDTNLYKSWNGSTWADVGVTPYATATGGTTSSITSSGVDYTLHTFTSSGNLVISSAGYVDILLVGAGGGTTGSYGSNIGAGGGGGGEVVLEFQKFLPAGTYSVVIGAGVSAGLGQRTYFVYKDSGLWLQSASGGGVGTGGAGGSTFGGGGGGSGGWGGSYAGGIAQTGRGGFPGGASGFNDTRGGGGGGAGGAGGPIGNGNGGIGQDISVFLGQAATTTYVAGGGRGKDNGSNGLGTGSANTGGGQNGQGAGAGFSGIAYFRSAS